MYPSVRMILPCLLFFAMLRAKRFFRLLKISVSGEFKYFGVESSITRPPKPMMLPRMSMIGNMRRFRNRSYMPPFLPETASPASRISSLEYPFPVIVSNSDDHSLGEKPSPNLVTVALLSPRFMIYARACSPHGSNSFWWKNRAASLQSAHSRSCFWYCDWYASSSGTSSPARLARNRTASG